MMPGGPLLLPLLVTLAASAPVAPPRLPDWAPPAAADLPHDSDLPDLREPPDPLVAMSGERVRSPERWAGRRKELLMLLQHYMYGYVPPLPDDVKVEDVRTAPSLEGEATRKSMTLRFGPEGKAAIHLVVVVPNKRPGPVPCLFGLDLDEAELAGTAVRRGYAFATFVKDELARDSYDFKFGVYPLYFRKGQAHRGPHEWGALGVWAWGLGIAARQLAAEPGLDPARLIVVGHSRKGKAALLAGALYERIGMVVAHQSGAAGAAPLRVARHHGMEAVPDLIDAFPHWFADVFAGFHEHPDKLPFEQSAILALQAPRPVLIGVGPTSHWTNPEGCLKMLGLADPVYRLLGVDGLLANADPRARGKLSEGRLGFYVRKEDGHLMTADDWERFMDYADAQAAHGSFGPPAGGPSSPRMSGPSAPSYDCERHEDSPDRGLLPSAHALGLGRCARPRDPGHR